MLGTIIGLNPSMLGTTPDPPRGNFAGNAAFANPIDPRPTPQGRGQNVFFSTSANGTPAVSFDLTSNSAAIDNALTSLAPTRDFLFRTRVDIASRGFAGRGPADVGAFEFLGGTSVSSFATRSVAAGPALTEQTATSTAAPTTTSTPTTTTPDSASSKTTISPARPITLGTDVTAGAIVSNSSASQDQATTPMTPAERLAALRARRFGAWARFASRRGR